MSNQLFPFQSRGVQWLAQSGDHILGDEPGLGKTVQGVMAVHLLGARRTLVLCPPIATGVWRQHFIDWGGVDPSLVRVVGEDSLLAADSPDAIIVCPFSRISINAALCELLGSQAWDFAIVDELHYLKNVDAARSARVYGSAFDRKDSILQRASKIALLSGTPLLSHAGDLWPMLHAIFPERIKVGSNVLSEAQFLDRFCVLRHVPKRDRPLVIGARRVEELRERLAPIMLRRRKSQVLPDLPPLIFSEYRLPDIPIPPDVASEIAELLPGADQMTDDELFDELAGNRVAMMTVRRLIGEIKAPAVAEIVDDFLMMDPTRKAIVFAYHTRVIDRIAGDLAIYNPVVLDGSVTGARRDSIVRAFQETAYTSVIVLQITAGSTAVTLHAASDVFFAESSFTPNENIQAASRAHRIGQKNSVTARFISLPGTIDQRIQNILVRKARDIAKVLGDTEDHYAQL